MIKYLVTGAAGHLGMNIVKKLVDNGEKVSVFVLPNDKNVKYLPSLVEINYGDVTNNSSVDNFIKKNSDNEIIFIHCAGIVSIASKYNELTYDVNVKGTKNVVDICLKYKVKRLVYISSVHAIKELPKNEVISETNHFNKDEVVGLYAKTKAEATNYVLESTKKGLDVVIVHPSGIVGPYDYGRGHITQLIIDFCKGHLTAGINGGYDFVDARDVAEGVILATKKGIKGECYILSNKYFKIKDLIKILSKVTGKKEINVYLPLWFAKVTAPLSEFYYKILKQPPLYTSYSLYTLQSNANFSHDKATKELGYNPRSFEETIKDTVDFLKENHRI